MTHTIQPLSRTFAQETKKIRLAQPKEDTCDIFAVCESMNKLCETLGRLAYVLQRKNFEESLKGKI